MGDFGTIGSVLLFVSLTWNLSSVCARGYDESCDLTASVAHLILGTSEASATCETEKGLFCVPFVGKCGCFVPGSVYINDKCRARINMPCFGPDFKSIECIENAKCTNETFNFCKCNEGYNSNDEGTACVAKERFILQNHIHNSETEKESSGETPTDEKSFESKQTFSVGNSASASNVVFIVSVLIFITGYTLS